MQHSPAPDPQENLHAQSGGGLEAFSIGLDPEVRRFRDIVRGKVREDLKKHISSHDIIAQHGNKAIGIKVPVLDFPNFRFGSNEEGVGEGGEGQGKGQGGSNQGGEELGKHLLEEEFHVEELAQMLGEELQLPRIQPRPSDGLEQDFPRYSSISRTGPASLRDNKRTFKEALKRAMSEGTYDQNNPVILPFKEDFRYRAPRVQPKPKTSAVAIYIIDCSGSMGDHQRELSRSVAFWIDAWLEREYKGCQQKYIVHDVGAMVVDRDTFFRTSADGGTRISSAYRTAEELIRTEFPPDQWNIYLFHFSDGDNSSDADTSDTLKILEEKILPHVNLYGFTLTPSHYGSGTFSKSLRETFGEREEVVVSELAGRDGIVDTIKALLGTGK